MTVHESLTRQAHRCVDHLNTVDPGSHEFSMTLENMERLMAIRQFVAECLDTEPKPENHCCDCDCHSMETSPEPPVLHVVTMEEQPVAPIEEVTTSEPSTTEGEEKTYTKEEVRAALGAARAKGVNVTELMKKFGVDKFPAFPAGRYGELMTMLEGMMT